MTHILHRGTRYLITSLIAITLILPSFTQAESIRVAVNLFTTSFCNCPEGFNGHPLPEETGSFRFYLNVQLPSDWFEAGDFSSVASGTLSFSVESLGSGEYAPATATEGEDVETFWETFSYSVSDIAEAEGTLRVPVTVTFINDDVVEEDEQLYLGITGASSTLSYKGETINLDSLNGPLNAGGAIVITSEDVPPPPVVVDTESPTVTISQVPPTSLAPFTALIDFSEVVEGFTLDDITVVNATLSELTETTLGKTWAVLVTPTAAGAVTLDIAVSVVQDGAGNENVAATQVGSIYRPGITVVEPVAGAETLTLNFNFGLNEDNTPDGGAFAVAVDGTAVPVSSVAFGSVVLSLGSPLTEGEGTLAYTASSAGNHPLTNELGGRVEDFELSFTVQAAPDNNADPLPSPTPVPDGSLWSATLTVEDLGGSFWGCSADAVGAECSTSLSSVDFEWDGVSYTPEIIFSGGSIFELHLTPAFPADFDASELKVVVGDTTVPVSLNEGRTAFIGDGSVSLDWTDETGTVEISLTTEAATTTTTTTSTTTTPVQERSSGGKSGKSSTQRTRAQDAIREVERLLEDTSSPRAEAKLEEAQEAYDRKDYREARSLAWEARDIFREEQEETAREDENAQEDEVVEEESHEREASEEAQAERGNPVPPAPSQALSEPQTVPAEETVTTPEGEESEPLSLSDSLEIVYGVGSSGEGDFGNRLETQAGETIYYQAQIFNSSDEDLRLNLQHLVPEGIVLTAYVNRFITLLAGETYTVLASAQVASTARPGQELTAQLQVEASGEQVISGDVVVQIGSATPVPSDQAAFISGTSVTWYHWLMLFMILASTAYYVHRRRENERV